MDLYIRRKHLCIRSKKSLTLEDEDIVMSSLYVVFFYGMVCIFYNISSWLRVTGLSFRDAWLSSRFGSKDDGSFAWPSPCLTSAWDGARTFCLSFDTPLPNERPHYVVR